MVILFRAKLMLKNNLEWSVLEMPLTQAEPDNNVNSFQIFTWGR